MIQNKNLQIPTHYHIETDSVCIIIDKSIGLEYMFLLIKNVKLPNFTFFCQTEAGSIEIKPKINYLYVMNMNSSKVI